MSDEKETDQDRKLREQGARIAANEEAIRRQTQALEQIRDHYYPPPEKWYRKVFVFVGKALCIVVAYLGIAEAVDWLWNIRVSNDLAEKYADFAKNLFLEEGNASGAETFYRKAIALNGDDSGYRVGLSIARGVFLGIELLGMDRALTADEFRRVNEAELEASVLKSQDPRNPLPYVMKAQALLFRGAGEEALAEIDAGVALAPQAFYPRVCACAMRYFTGHREEARAHLAEAERLGGNRPIVRFWKGLLALYCDHDAETAKTIFENLCKVKPHQAVLYTFLGRALLAMEKPDYPAARKAFLKAIKLAPDQWHALRGMAESYERTGQLAVARIWLDRVLLNDKNDIVALVARARVNDKTGEYAASIDDLTSAIALAPLRSDLYRLRAAVWDKTGETARAAKDRATVVELESGAEKECRIPTIGF